MLVWVFQRCNGSNLIVNAWWKCALHSFVLGQNPVGADWMRGKSVPTIQYTQPFEVSDLQGWRLARTIYIHGVYTYMVCGTFDMIFWTLYECLPLEAFSVNLPQINRHCCIITAVDLGNAPFPGQKKRVQNRHQAPHSSPICQILARLNDIEITQVYFIQVRYKGIQIGRKDY